MALGSIVDLFVMWLCRDRTGPSEVTDLKLGTPLRFMFDQGSSRVPFSCAVIIAFVIRPFCLRMARVIMYAVSLHQMGIQFTLGIAWCIATVRSLVPLTCEVRNSFASTSSLQVSKMKRTSFLNRSMSCHVVMLGRAMSSADLSLMGA